MSPNSIEIIAWEGVLGLCVLTEGHFSASSHFLLVKHAMVKDEKLDCRKSFPENVLLCRPSFGGRKNLMMEKMLIMYDSARHHESTEGRLTSL